MALKADYVRLIKALLPPGPAWPVDDTTSERAILIDEIAGLCEDLDRQAAQLFVESDPHTCAVSFQDWLTEWGIPDECVLAFNEGELSQDQLRDLLIFKASLQAGQSRKFFKRLAALFGRQIEIQELADAPNDPELDRFTWRVNVLSSGGVQPYTEATVQMGANDPLATFGDALLECEIRKLRPAGTRVLFAYVDAADAASLFAE